MIKKKFFKNLRKPFLIAEISANHNGSLEKAKKIIKTAKQNGADAVKLQTYEPHSMTIDSKRNEFKIKKGLWKNYTLWELFERAQTPFSWHEELFSFARKNKIMCFSSAFDQSSIDVLEKLKCPFYKIASFEITDFSLIKKISRTGKPLLVSTGLSTLREIDDTMKFAKKCGIKDIALLYCVSSYPAKDEDFNLKNILILKKKYKCEIGFSDHSNNIEIAKIALSLGATIFEKHVALDGQKKGFDLKFSLKGKEIKNFKKQLEITSKLIGEEKFLRKKNEMENLRFRRSIYSIKNIKKGDIFSEQNIKCIRPSNGLDPKFFFKILNKKAKINIKKGTPLKREYY